MNPLQKLLNPKAAPTREIIFTRNCAASGKSWKRGDKATLSEKVAGELIACEAAYDPTAIPTAQAKAKQLDELLPPPVTPEELPESYKDLPAPFTAYHKLNAAFQALGKRQDAIWDVLLPRIKGYVIDADVRSMVALPRITRDVVLGAYAGRVHVGAPDERETREEHFLKDSYHRAEKACKDWEEANNDEAFRTRILCGDTVKEVHEKLCVAIGGLHKTGLEIFSLRISGLGLSGQKVTELYSGSADAEKYSCFDMPSLNNMKLAYYEENVGGRSYCDLPVNALVSRYNSFSKNLDEVSATLKQAEAELSKTQKSAA